MIRRLGVTSVAVSALLALAACGGSEEGGGETAATTPSATAPGETGAPERAEAAADGSTAGTTPTPTATEGATAGDMSAPASPDAASDAAGGGTSAPATSGGSAAAGGGVVLAGLTGDAAAGQRVFRQCQTCHSVKPGENKVGPSLHGIVGRQAGTIPGFRYSPANKNSGATWNEETLFAYLEDPRKFMPGTYMSFVGLKQPQQRADVIAYLKTQS
jgi:cytochrome c